MTEPKNTTSLKAKLRRILEALEYQANHVDEAVTRAHRERRHCGW